MQRFYQDIEKGGFSKNLSTSLTPPHCVPVKSLDNHVSIYEFQNLQNSGLFGCIVDHYNLILYFQTNKNNQID